MRILLQRLFPLVLACFTVWGMISPLAAYAQDRDTLVVTAVEKTEAHPYFGIGFHRGFAINGVEGDTIIMVRDSLYIFNIQALYPDPDFTTHFNIYSVPIGGTRDFYTAVIESTTASEGIWRLRPTKITPDTLYYAASNKPWVGGTLVIVDSLPTSGVGEGYNVRIVSGTSRVVPNPFSSQAYIRFSLPEPSHVRLELFDPLGRRVMGGSAGLMEGGENTIPVNGMNLQSGIYHYRVIATTAEEQMVMTGNLQVLR